MRGIFLFLIMIPALAWSQNISVSGRVIDKAGEGIIGASVQVPGTTTGITTDVNGDYTLNGVPSNGRLQFSYIGYTTQTVDVNGRSVINITLPDDEVMLEEVVVIGYGTQRREAVTGSVASMQGNVLRQVQTGNVTSALAGRVAGVQMTQTNSKPGADMQIRIRGVRSLNASNDPLIVLDGIPFPGTIGDINPNDIKSIDVLKDASATAIYGSRGANGVIIITTNKGVFGQKARVTYDAYYGVKTLYHRYPMMSGDELYEMRKEAGIYKDTEGNPTMGSDEAHGTNTDWQDLMFDNGMVMSHDIGIAGGTETGSFNFGAGYYKDQSMLPGQNYNRINLRATIDQNVGKYLRFGITTNSNYNVTNGQNLGLYQTLALSSMIDPYNSDGGWKPFVSSIADANVWAYSRDAIESLGDKYADNQRGYASYNSLYGEVKIPYVEGLAYRINLGLNLRGFNRGQYAGQNVFSFNANSNGSLEKALTYQWVVENLLTYDKYFGNHHINFTGLYSEEQTHYDRSRVSAINIPADFFQYWNLGRADKADVTVNPDEQRFEEYGLKSVMGRLMYDYDNRYMISVALRSDGSSRLAPGHKWHTYPAVSAGWNIGREAFMESVDWIDNLKLRVGYGETSNQAVAPYKTLGLLSTERQQYNFGTTSLTTGARISEAPNPDLGWEYSSTWNFGLDFSLIGNRLWGSVEYYVVNTNDLLMNVDLPSSSGIASYTANVGKSQNKGLEFALNGTILDNKDGWSWDAGINFYTNKNKIVELASGQTEDRGNKWFVGYPINSIYDYKKIGIWQQNDPYLNILEPGGNPGMIKVLYTGDYNPNGAPVRQIGADDMQVIDPTPNWLGGFNTRVAYKNWDLNVIGSFQNGGILISTLHSSSGYLNLLTGRRGNVQVDYWTPENTDTKYPRPGGIQSGDNQKYGTTLSYFDATYFKVGQITLGYNFNPDAKWFKFAGLGSARLYFTLQNAFVLFSPFNDETGLDPLTNSYGNENVAVQPGEYKAGSMPVVGTNTPQTRNFLFGLNVSF
ncbi:MAG: TonB-dependent receptor [Tannerella sp.]|nr:TonB-dependent receptor [Tannerella sp.]